MPCANSLSASLIGRERHGVRVAHEQLPPDLGFELADVLADRRLPEAQPAAGFREAAGLSDGEE